MNKDKIRPTVIHVPLRLSSKLVFSQKRWKKLVQSKSLLKKFYILSSYSKTCEKGIARVRKQFPSETVFRLRMRTCITILQLLKP